MLRNYLRSAYRNIIKSKTFSFINIFGLSIGLSAFLLIMHYVLFENSYDDFNDDADRIYRIRYERYSEDGSSVKFASCCPPAGELIRERFTGFENLGRMVNYKASISRDEISFMEERMFFTEPDIFNILKFDFVKGNPFESLKNPGNAFISETTAEKYFGEENPIGKEFSIDKKIQFQVSGIYKDNPINSHFKADIILPFENLKTLYGDEYLKAWGHTGSYTYVKLNPQTNVEEFQKKINDLAITEFGEALAYWKMEMKLPLQPLKNIHLTSNFMQEYETNGNNNSVNFLFIIAVFVIVMAWVNYINLSTASSLNRAKEVGLRKVVGASRKNLVYQFFVETSLINLFAVICSLLIILFITPYFNNLTGLPSNVLIWDQPLLFLAIFGLFIFGIIFSGFYPITALTSFKPVVILKGNFKKSNKGSNLRKFLVVFQFVIAFILITGTMAVYKQIVYMQNENLGFDIYQVLVLQSPRVRDENFSEKLKTFKEIINKNSAIELSSHVTEVPGRQIYWDAGAIRKQGEDQSKGKNYQIVGIDEDFSKLFNLEFVAGRNFSHKFPSDKEGVILNETAVKFMGFDDYESAIGKKVDYWGEIFTIVGVLKNYHQQSLKENFEPHIYRFMPEGRKTRGQIALKLNNANAGVTIDFVKKQYKEFFPGNPFEFFFLDEYFNQQYKSDQQFGLVVGVFSLLAIVITLLGVFGLSLNNALQRTKEIGIRKVLGADIKNIMVILSKDFIILMLVSFIIASPLLYFGLNKFLENFANRINLDVFIFLIPMLIIFFITLITITFQFIKAAIANPVETLKYE